MNLTREQSRQVDRLARDQYDIPGILLMENAGIHATNVLDRHMPSWFQWITICCGKGNNGGDGFVVARHLLLRKYKVRVWIFTDPESLQGDAAVQYKILQNLFGCVERFSADREEDLKKDFSRSYWIVDALLGTGATGPPSGEIRRGIELINEQKRVHEKCIFAIDVPSGLDCDTGLPSEPTIEADRTCTFVAAKTGFAAEEAKRYLGTVHIVNIGIPSEKFVNEVTLYQERR